MQIQALILSLIILVSLLISGVSSSTKSSESKLALENTEPAMDSGSVFLEDLYSVLSKKIVFISQSTIRGLTSGINIINQNFSAAEQILSNTKQILSNKTNSLLLTLASRNDIGNENDIDNDLKPNNSDFSSQAISPVSEAETNNSPSLNCDFSQFTFSSKVILVKYLDYNLDIYKLNLEKRWPIASLTKLMTSLIALEKIGLDKEVIMSERAVSSEGVAGDFKVGEVFKVEDLIKAMLVTSSNDAAMAVTEILGEKNFINEMQRKASELKMLQTTFLEPTGLSFINQSTITDLTKLMNYINLTYPELLEISRQRETTIMELKTGKLRKISNVNYFAGQADFIGGKTGYIEEAGRNLMALFNINGKTVLIITLGADDSFGETKRLKSLVKNCSDFTYEQSK